MQFRVNGDEVEAPGKDAAVAAWTEANPLAIVQEHQVEQLTFRVADLDVENVYWGMKEIPAAELTDAHVRAEAFGGDCDLPVGRYKWLRDKGHFDAMEKTKLPPAPAVPSFEAAAYDYWRGLELTGEKVPARTAAWLRWHETTIEGRVRTEGPPSGSPTVRGFGIDAT